MIPGTKLDAGKPRWSLMPWSALTEVAKVLTAGAQKYADDNWQQVPQARERYFSAAMRHLTAWYLGEKTDAETGLSHLAHAACCLLFLLWFDLEEEKSAVMWRCGKCLHEFNLNEEAECPKCGRPVLVKK